MLKLLDRETQRRRRRRDFERERVLQIPNFVAAGAEKLEISPVPFLRCFAKAVIIASLDQIVYRF